MGRSASEIEGLLERLRRRDAEGDEMADALATEVVRKNRENAYRFLRTPFSERLVCVPQCLRSTEDCLAEERNSEFVCKGCGACKIAEIAARARELGYMDVKILKGGSALSRVIAETGARALLGVSCCIEAVMGVLVCERAGVSAFCVPLLRAGCSDTDVDLDDVKSALEAVLP